MKWREIDRKYNARTEELRKQSPYELLGVSATDSLSTIKAAYRRKVKLYHPDRTDDFMKKYSQEVVKLLNNAMEIIENTRKK